MLDEVAEHGVGETVFIRPLGIAKDAHELRLIRRFDCPHGGLEGAADIAAGLPDLAPVSLGRDLEAVVLGEEGEILIPSRVTQCGHCLLVIDIAETLQEKQGEDELLVVSRIDRASQEHGSSPEVGLKLLLGDAGHFYPTSKRAFWSSPGFPE